MPGNIYVYTSQHVNIIFFLLTFPRAFVWLVGWGFFPLDFMLHIIYLILLIYKTIMECCSWRCAGLSPGSRWGVGSQVHWSTRAGWAWALPQQQEEGVSDSRGELLLEGDRGYACPPGFMPTMASCLPSAWMCYRDIAKACTAFGLSPLAVFPERPQWCCQGDVEQISSVNALLWGWGWKHGSWGPRQFSS